MNTPYKTGERVKAFDPRTMGVIREGVILSIGTKYVGIDFGLTGKTKIHIKDIVQPA